MPDPKKETVSASQVPALFNRSPYVTRFMLHHHFTGKVLLDESGDDRMSWGNRLEGAILQAVADEQRLDILPHDQDVYFRCPSVPVGCTPDGYCLDPQLGLGFVEVKNVDFMRWRDTWHEHAAPDHIELQHQAQLMVPHPEHGTPKWGIIAALVGGNDLITLKRERNETVCQNIANQAEAFMACVGKNIVPPVIGEAMELPVITDLFPATKEGKVLSKEDFPDWEDLQEAMALYHFYSQRESEAKKYRAKAKAKILAAAEDAEQVRVPGYSVKVSRYPSYTPDPIPEPIREAIEEIER